MKNTNKGSVLPITIVFLTVVSITSIFSMQSNLLETKIINNIQKKQAVYHSSYGLLEDFFGDFSGAELEIREQLDKLVKGKLDNDGIPTGESITDDLDVLVDESSKILKSAEITYIGRQKSYISNEYSSLVFEIKAKSQFKNSRITSEQALTFRKLAPKIKNKL